MKYIAIATFTAAAVSGVYATIPQRKRSIENKYITNVDEHKSSPLAADPYLGLSNRKLEKDESMSMHHDDDHDHDMPGSSYCTYSPDKTCYVTGWPACCEDKETCPEEQPPCEIDGDHDHDEDGHKDDEHTSEDDHEGHDHGEDGETDHSDDMDKDAAASTESGAATLSAGVALLGGVALIMA